MKKIFCLIFIVSISLTAKTYKPQKIGTIDFKPISESSAIIKSRQYKDTYWTLNDSGDESRIFAINSNGKSIIPIWAKEFYKGVTIPDAFNIDWEDIALDNKNNLIIPACGNNGNARKDLSLYFVKEPNPFEVISSRILKKVDFYYPDQKEFPPKKENRNFDCEAIFSWNNTVYFFTKHRGNLNTKLYKLDTSKNYTNPASLKYIDKFKIDGMVTAADISKNGKQIAILTYYKLWLFERDDINNDNFFIGKAFSLDLNSEFTKQCEAVTFTGENLILTNEQRDIYKVPLKDFKK